MSERAYSKELKRIVTASEAVTLSAEGKLKNSRAFNCCNKKCGIDLTCTNWGNKDGIRKYFVPSCNDELHVIGCDEVSQRENVEQIGREIKEIVNEIEKNGIITMLTSPDRNTKENGDSEDKVETPKGVNGYAYKDNGQEKGKKFESRRAARVEAFVELYHRKDVDQKKRIIRINGNMYSLEELFISSSDEPVDDKMGIYFGQAVINSSFKPGMLEIQFENSKLPVIYTNVNCLMKIRNGSRAKKKIDTNERITVYFRGSYKGKKLTPFNDKNYKDLCFGE